MRRTRRRQRDGRMVALVEFDMLDVADQLERLGLLDPLHADEKAKITAALQAYLDKWS
jgi:hypothetical protein